MKHTLKITAILVSMFLLAQLIGIAVINQYRPETKQITVYTNSTNSTSTTLNETVYNYPFGMNPPQDNNPNSNLVSILIAIAIGVVLIFALMRMKSEMFIRTWFFLVIILALGISLNAFLMKAPYSAIISLAVALPLAIVKVFKRNIIVHNLTELLIYPGIAAIMVPLLNVFAVVLLLIVISIYDIYAVWHSGFMQKMAKYQIQKVRVFSGFFVPYINRKERKRLEKVKKLKSLKSPKGKIKVNIAILGGGDVVFPIILAGVVLMQFGILSAIMIAIGATIALSFLFYYSEKGRFYPAMPFISAGCLIALGVVYLLNFILFQ